MTRLVIVALSLVFIVGFAALTLIAVTEQGFTVASGLSIFVLVLLGVGVGGALLDRRR